MQPYDSKFFNTILDESQTSAEQVVPVVVKTLRPRSVVDVGCGTGTWLRAFQNAGVGEILGIDGDYVNRSQLMIPADSFAARDLSRPIALPVNRARRFDLAISLEVAEHLPPSSAETFVETLVSLAPKVLFSAAIPYQGGTSHLNEQWPNYWAAMFLARGYVTVDWIRPLLLNNGKVAWYYAQNALLFVDESHLAQFPDLQRYVISPDDASLVRIHPARWVCANEPRMQPLRKVIKSIPFAICNTLAARARMLTGRH